MMFKLKHIFAWLFFIWLVIFYFSVVVAKAEDDLKVFNRLDTQLVELYGKIMSLLPEEARLQFKDAQNKWLAYRESVCDFEAGLKTEGKSQKRKSRIGASEFSCKRRITAERIDYFQVYLNKLGYFPPMTIEKCKFVNMPPDYDVFAVVSKGYIFKKEKFIRFSLKETDVLLGNSSRIAIEAEVIINKEDKPIILVLSADQPVIWRVKRTPSSRITGVKGSSLLLALVKFFV